MVLTGDGPALRLLPGGRAAEPAPVVTDPDLTGDPGGDVRSVSALVGAAQPRLLVDEATARRRDGLPDPHPIAGQLAQAVVEVLAGTRPVTQLLTLLTEQLYSELSVLAPDPVTLPTLRGAPVITVHPQDRPRVRSVHLSRPAPGVAEVAARVQTHGRSRAVALRLEEWRGRWRCCALTIG